MDQQRNMLTELNVRQCRLSVCWELCQWALQGYCIFTKQLLFIIPRHWTVTANTGHYSVDVIYGNHAVFPASDRKDISPCHGAARLESVEADNGKDRYSHMTERFSEVDGEQITVTAESGGGKVFDGFKKELSSHYSSIQNHIFNSNSSNVN